MTKEEARERMQYPDGLAAEKQYVNDLLKDDMPDYIKRTLRNWYIGIVVMEDLLS
jgi:hypothetical protein